MGNHDNKRLASRFGYDRADLLNMLLQTLPGIAVTYNVTIGVFFICNPAIMVIYFYTSFREKSWHYWMCT